MGVRIVYVINSIKRSGPNQVLLNMVSGIQDKGYDIKVVAFFDGDQNEIDKLKQLNAQVDVLGVSKRSIVTDGAKKLRRYLDNSSPDVVHSHGILSDIAVIRSGFGKKSVTTIHNNMFEDYVYSFGRIRGTIYLMLHLIYLRKFSYVVCCSNNARMKLQRYIKRVKCIHNGISSAPVGDKRKQRARSALCKELGINLKDKVFLYAGNLTFGKGVLVLLEEFSKSGKDDEHLIVAGDGELLERCHNYSSKNIHIVGFQPSIQKYYQAADVYVSASLSEGFSIAIIEALQNNLLLLLANIPAHEEVFRIDNTMYIGELFSKNTFAENKIRLAYSQKQSKKYYEKYLTDAAMMEEYSKFYQELTT